MTNLESIIYEASSEFKSCWPVILAIDRCMDLVQISTQDIHMYPLESSRL